MADEQTVSAEVTQEDKGTYIIVLLKQLLQTPALPYLDDNSFSQTSKNDSTLSDTAIESDEDGVVDGDTRRRRKRDSESGSDDVEQGRCDFHMVLYSNGKFN